MKTTQKHQESTSEINRQRTAKKNAAIAFALLFVALMSGSGATSTPGENLTTRNIVWGILSVIAFASLLWALYVTFRQSDERQQLIQLKATSITSVAMIFSLVTAQILFALDIVDLNISVQVIVIGGIILWTSLMKAVERQSN